MKDRIDGEAISGRLIKDLEGESPDKSPAELVHYDRVELGISLDGEHTRLYATQEFLTKPRFPASYQL